MHQENLVHQGLKEFLVKLEDLESLEKRGHQDHLDPWVKLVFLVLRDCQVFQEKEDCLDSR